VLLCAGQARAATYDVQACDYAGGPNYSWQPRTNHPNMAAFVACPAGSGPDAGIVVRTVVRQGQTVPLNAYAHQEFYAPAGTSIVRVEFSGFGHKANGSRYQVGLSNGSSFLWGWSAGNNPQLSWFGAPNHEVVNMAGSSVVYFEVLCGSPGGCSNDAAQGSPPSQADLHLSGISVRLEDHLGPGWDGASGWHSGWHNGDDRFAYAVNDNTGIREMRLVVDGTVRDHREYGCNYAFTVPCATHVDDALNLDTKVLSDAEHSFSIVAVDAAGNTAPWDGKIQTDNTPPGPVGAATLDGGEGWRSTNDFTARWSNPGDQVAPIAGAWYQLCRADAPTSCGAEIKRTGASITSLPHLEAAEPGDYILRVWLVDAAENAQKQNAIAAGHIRFDNEPPRDVGFEAPRRGDPPRLFLHATDAVSGLAGGDIELRREGTSDWRPLTTSSEKDGVEASLDDTALADGAYDVRGRVRDRAGNERSTDALLAGGRMRVVLPLRSPFSIVAGFERRKRAARKRGKRRGKTRLLTSVRVGFGRNVVIRGHVLDPAGRRVPGARVAIDQGPSSDRLSPLALITMDRNGVFRHIVGPGTNRLVRVRYVGSELTRPASTILRLHVTASSSMRARPQLVLNGGSTTFSGKLRGLVPKGGKLVALQAFFRGHWRTFATPRTDARGAWRSAYRFEATRGRVRYRFRVLIPSEPAYPYASGRSRPISVAVQGL
jgi:hypothetical protein